MLQSRNSREAMSVRKPWHVWLLVIALLVAGITPALQAAPAEAASISDGFQPGRIISDELFYQGSAMTTAEVQAFLNKQVSNCRIGDPGYKPGDLSPSGSGNRIASACLKNFKMTTQSRPADAYCKAYAGAANESAAQIITKVGQACGISQRVILIMLEKEQSLVTDSWPVTRQYSYAMGMDCPDSGPGNSANCDESGAGFFQQVIRGTRQLQVYRLNPSSFRYKPFQTNTIQWHPNTGCGTSQVYIENRATASLYIYTPYRPNQAALNAGWGTGDGCSTYGNRNFYNFYKSWFGSPSGIPVTGKIQTFWEKYGASGGVYGTPKAAAQSISANGGGLVQEFTGGVIFMENKTGTVTGMQNGVFLTNYRGAGFVQGSWGWPVEIAKCGLASGGCTMKMQNGTVAYSNTYGSQLIAKQLEAEWARAGGAGGAYGYPRSAAEFAPKKYSLVQHFANGHLAWSEQGGARVFHAQFVEPWKAIGGINGALGVPAAPVDSVVENGGGKIQEFTNGTMFGSSRGSFAMENGAFRSGYLNAGGPAGSWGWPAGKASCGLPGGGCQMPFQNGIGMWSSGTGMVLVSQDSFDMWNMVKGSIGYPSKVPSKLTVNGGGEVQEFTNGTVWTSPLGSFAMENGAFRSGYLNAGGPAGSWGWPAGKASCGLPGGGCQMPFQNGEVRYENGVFSLR